MPVVNPGIRRFLGSAIQRLFNGASFSAPLTHSAIPTRAASGTTATFTRATTSTWPNNDGYMVTGVAGEIGFVGARRVRNLLTFTEDFTNAAWTKINGGAGSAPTVTSGFTDPDGGTSAWRLQANRGGNAAGDYSVLRQNGHPSGNCRSIYVKSNTGSTQEVYFGAANGPADKVSVTTSWTRVSNPKVSNTITDIGTYGTVGNSTQSIDILIWHPQCEDVTAQTTQTAGEYVSVGVPSDWAGDELVTNGTFDTDSDWTKDTGWAISGGVAAYDGSKGSNSTLNTVDTVFVAGQKYVISFDIVAISGNVNFATLAYTSGSYNSTGTKIAEYTHSGADSALYLNALDSGAATVTFDNISVKPAYYHGSFVDGVKCFPTDLSGNPIPSTTLLGYQAQGARTNLCLQSNAFTTTWTNANLSVLAQNAIGPDGATSAWTATDSVSGVNSFVSQTIALTSGSTYTASFFIKKTTGAQTSYPVIFANFSTTGAALCTVDTSNGVATVWTALTGFTIVASSATCASFNADFWRVSLVFTANVTNTWNLVLYPSGTTNATQSTGTTDQAAQGSAVFYGAQVELGSFASSYIATTTIAVARNADVLTYSSAGNVSTTSGAMYMETVVAINQVAPQLIVHDALANNYFSMDDGGSAAGALRTLVSSGGAITANFNTGSSSANTVVKRAMSWEVNSVDGCINGTLGVRDTSCAMPLSITTISVGGAGTPVGASTFRNIRAFGRKLSPSELQAVTA